MRSSLASIEILLREHAFWATGDWQVDGPEALQTMGSSLLTAGSALDGAARLSSSEYRGSRLLSQESSAEFADETRYALAPIPTLDAMLGEAAVCKQNGGNGSGRRPSRQSSGLQQPLLSPDALSP
eukprot:4051488-Amphidinium_carterae.1